MNNATILLTNDDGIESPGLAAAAAGLDGLGDLLIVAPAEQQTSMGRSRTVQGENAGALFKRKVVYGSQEWEGVAVNATPALTVEYAVQEIATKPIALAVSGINYGENIGTCVTVSGTIGAALEAAEHRIPSLAISLELAGAEYHSFSQPVNFETASYFTHYFAAKVLKEKLPHDIDLLKIEIPCSATPQSKWVVTRQDRFVYYRPTVEKRPDPFVGKGTIRHLPQKGRYTTNDTDAYAQAQGWVSVTPLSLDLTSRVDLNDLTRILSEEKY
jgi:5'-nucleotidase